jgi:hypothetical protein
MQNIPKPSNDKPSVLASLRALIPRRPLARAELLRVIELQANRLLELNGIADCPVPTEIITELPHIELVHEPMPMSGAVGWNGHSWVIFLDPTQGEGRWRFTLLHEFAHIINHGHEHHLFRGSRSLTPRQQAERAANYFAGCALVPRRLLKRAWGEGIQRTTDLAETFEVSTQAIEVRLRQVGLVAQDPRCGLDQVRIARTTTEVAA